MKIKSIILNVLLIIILICLIYFFIYLNNSNFENFADGIISNPLISTNDNSIETIKIDEEQIGIVSSPVELEKEIKINNGLTFDKPLKNANFGYILEAVANDNDFKPKYIDGYYWINIQNVGTKYIYCIMDKSFKGGGWMLAMRSVYGSQNFSYNSEHFTLATTLNSDSEYISNNVIKDINDEDFKISSIGNKIFDYNIDPNIYDAKFDTFNNTLSAEWMAIFYVKDNEGNIIKGGDIQKNNRGYVWYETNVKIDDTYNKIKRIVSPMELFKFLDKSDRKINVKYAQNMGGKFTNANTIRQSGPAPFQSKNILFSSQPISEGNINFYGLNYNSGRPITNVRWGFTFNDSADNSNDVCGGIGTSYTGESTTGTRRGNLINKNKGYSAGNFEVKADNNATFFDRPVEELRNTSYAVEWYVRELGINCSV